MQKALEYPERWSTDACIGHGWSDPIVNSPAAVPLQSEFMRMQEFAWRASLPLEFEEQSPAVFILKKSV